MKKITLKTIKMATVFMLLVGASFKVNAQNFTTGSQVGSTGDWFYNTIAKDVNSDGYDDILSIDNGNNLRVILSNGSGGFNAATTLGSSLWTFKAEDLDNDGDVDIVASSIQANTPGFYIYKNNGSGSFTLQSTTPTNITFSNYAVAAQVMDLVVFDANGDGKKDIVLVPYIYSTNGTFDSRTRHFLFTNTSSGSTISFNQTAIISTNQPCIHGMAADIDNDGDQDLVLDGGSSNTTEVFKNSGSGNFSFTGYANGYSGGQFFYDWNKDGFLDIITMDAYNGYGLRWKQNDGQGNFAAGVQLLATNNNPGFFADMNGDGLVDAVYGGNNAVGTPGYIQVYTNTGCGFSATPSIYSTQLSNNTGIGVTKIDANHDGKPDVFVSTRGEVNRIAVNNIATATAPILSAITSVQNGSRCGSGNVTVGATASNSGSITWWDAASGGSQITNGNSLSTTVNTSAPTQSFWVDASLNGCRSSRVKVVALYKGESTTSITNINVCSNQLPYSWNGVNYTAAGTYTKTGLVNAVGCDSIATLVLSIGSPVIPSLTISTPSNIVCNNAAITFTAISTTGGSSPVYTWKKNSNNVGSGSSITFLSGTLSNNDTIRCVLTANNACQTSATATSNAIAMTVKQSPSVAQITNGTSNITSATLCALTKTTAYYNSTPYGTWSSSDPAVASVTGGSQAGVVTANTNGTTTISYNITATNGCVSNSSVLVTVAQQSAPTAITGTNSICVNATTALSSTAPVGTTGVWSSSSDRGIISVGGVYTGKNAGAGEARYTVTNTTTGCKAYATYAITVNAIPAVPTITYQSGTPNPQLGAPAGGFCLGKIFTVVGTPNVPAGVWSSTGATSITGGGVVTINAVGAGSIKYTYTSAAGCVNSRTMSGNGYTCAARGAISNEQLAISNDFTMYPNPAKGFINLNVETLVGKGSIVVSDLYGKSVKTQNLSMGSNTVNIANLSKGMYFVSTITTEGKTTKKLVVE